MFDKLLYVMMGLPGMRCILMSYPASILQVFALQASRQRQPEALPHKKGEIIESESLIHMCALGPTCLGARVVMWDCQSRLQSS